METKHIDRTRHYKPAWGRKAPVKRRRARPEEVNTFLMNIVVNYFTFVLAIVLGYMFWRVWWNIFGPFYS